MVGFGIGLSGYGAAQPEIRQQQDQRLKMQQLENKKKAEAAIMQAMRGQQQPGGPPALPGQTSMPGMIPSTTPGGAPSAAPPALPGSSPAPGSQGFAGGMPDLMTMMAALDKSGIPPDQQYEALTQYGAFASPFEKMQNQLTMAQQKMDMQQDMLKERLGMMETIARMNNSTRERGQDINASQKETVVTKNDVVKAYRAHQADPENKELEKNWSDLRDALNSTKAEKGGVTESDKDTIDMYAKQMAETGRMPQGLGYTDSPFKRAIAKRAKELNPDIDLAKSSIDYAGKLQESRSIATRSAPAKIAVKEMDNLGKPMIDAISKVNTSQYPDVNSLMQAYQKRTGGAEVSKAAIAIQEFKTAFTNLMVRNGVPTDQARGKADNLIPGNMSLNQARGIVEQAKISGSAVIDALAEAKGETPVGGDGWSIEPVGQ